MTVVMIERGVDRLMMLGLIIVVVEMMLVGMIRSGMTGWWLWLW